jgi:Protein of unknown function (DUF2911)
MSNQHRVTVAAVACAALLMAGTVRADLQLPRLSPNASVTQRVGTTDITINYCRPGVKDRVIWGGLVPYGKVWRTGANEATQFIVTDGVTIDGKPLPAGTYQLATIPGKDEWTVIFNKAAHEWGAFSYDPKLDVLRIQVRPRAAPYVERMQFAFDDLTDDSANVVLRWEKLEVPFTVKVDVNGTTLAKARKSVADAKPDDWRTPYVAASFCVHNKVDLTEGKAWLAKSLAIKENVQNLSLKATILADEGDVKGAIAIGKRALAMGKAANANGEMLGELEKSITGWEAKK